MPELWVLLRVFRFYIDLEHAQKLDPSNGQIAAELRATRNAIAEVTRTNSSGRSSEATKPTQATSTNVSSAGKKKRVVIEEVNEAEKPAAAVPEVSRRD